MRIVYPLGIAGDDSLSVHPFPAASVIPSGAGSLPVRRPDPLELMLVAGLVLATTTQFALCAWFWLA